MRDIGIDLGTATILIYQKGRGVVLCEPSVVAINVDTNKVVAVGEAARRMIGRTPGSIVAIRPLKEGVIADYQVTETMLKHFINQVCGKRRLIKPQMIICVPSGVTSVEKKAVLDAAMQAGAKRAYPISEPMAAAIGAGLNVVEPSGNMVVDVGGGTTDIAVISLGEEVIGDSIRIGGDKFDEAIVRYIRRTANLLIGERSAEQLKIEISNVYQPSKDVVAEVRGRDAVSGLPKTIVVRQDQLAEALDEPVRAITQAVRSVLEKTPPELASDIIDKGMVLTGGGALLKGLPELLSEETGIATHLADDPTSCVALGTGKALENLDILGDKLMTSLYI
jgi:rod shape-determining protein MreB